MTRFHGYALFALTFHAFFAAECRTPRRETHVSAVRPPPRVRTKQCSPHIHKFRGLELPRTCPTTQASGAAPITDNQSLSSTDLPVPLLRRRTLRLVCRDVGLNSTPCYRITNDGDCCVRVRGRDPRHRRACHRVPRAKLVLQCHVHQHFPLLLAPH